MMTDESMDATGFPAIALDPPTARELLHAVERRAIGTTLDHARRVIAAREATIEVLRLEPPASRTPRPRGALSTLLRPARASGGVDPAEIDRLAGSGLFLAGWYGERHREAVAGGDPWAHFVATGLPAGLAPNPFFDPAWYAAAYLDGAQDEPAILHYLRIGARYALTPGPLFDSAAYLLADEAIAGEPDPLVHFLSRGIDAGRVAIPIA
jgi:hypothetical protein